MPLYYEKGFAALHPRQERIIGIGNRGVCLLLKSKEAETDRGGGRGVRYESHYPTYCMLVKTEEGVVSDILLVIRFTMLEEGMR